MRERLFLNSDGCLPCHEHREWANENVAPPSNGIVCVNATRILEIAVVDQIAVVETSAIDHLNQTDACQPIPPSHEIMIFIHLW
jgi:hypothetical protein